MKGYWVWLKLFQIFATRYALDVIVGRKPMPCSWSTVWRNIGDDMYDVLIQTSIETGYWPRGLKAQARMRGYDV